MEKDCFAYVKQCHKCQEHNKFIHAPASELHAQISIWSFSIWGLDLIGKCHHLLMLDIRLPLQLIILQNG